MYQPIPSPPLLLGRPKPPIFDLHSSSPESFTALERTCLQAQLDRAKTRLVAFRPGSPARELSPASAARVLENLDETSEEQDVHGHGESTDTACEEDTGPKSWVTVVSHRHHSPIKKATAAGEQLVGADQDRGCAMSTEEDTRNHRDADMSFVQSLPPPPPPPPCTPTSIPLLKTRHKNLDRTAPQTPSKRTQGFSLPSNPHDRPAPPLRSSSTPAPSTGALSALLSRTSPVKNDAEVLSPLAAHDGFASSSSLDRSKTPHLTGDQNATTEETVLVPEVVLSSDTWSPISPPATSKLSKSESSTPTSLRQNLNASQEEHSSLVVAHSPLSDSSYSSCCSETLSNPTTASGGSASSLPTASSSSRRPAPYTPKGKAPPVTLASTGRNALGLPLPPTSSFPPPPQAASTSSITATLGSIFAPLFPPVTRPSKVSVPPALSRRHSTSPPTPRYRSRPSQVAPPLPRKSIMDPSLTGDALALPFTRRNTMRRQSSVGEVYFPNSANLCLSGWEREKRRRKDVALGFASPRNVWETSGSSASDYGAVEVLDDNEGYSADVEEEEPDYYRFEPSVFASVHSNSATSLSSASSARSSRALQPSASMFILNKQTQSRRRSSSSGGSNFTTSPFGSSPSASLTISPLPVLPVKVGKKSELELDSSGKRRSLRKDQDNRRRSAQLEAEECVRSAAVNKKEDGNKLRVPIPAPSERKKFFFV